MRTLRLGGFSPGQVKLLSAGRVLDTTRLIERAGYTPAFSTIEAFDDFAAALRPALAASTVRHLEVRVAEAVGTSALPIAAARPRAVGRASTSPAEPFEPASESGEVGPDPVADPMAADELGVLDQQRIGRPRLVGITGEAAGTPRRRRTR